MVNYYELLEISQDADNVAIGQAIKKTRRLWNNRANSPDASIRAEAEQNVKYIAEAEQILTNPQKREQYDRELAQTPEPGDSPEPPDEDWEDAYFEAYEKDLCDYAAQIAQLEIANNGRNGRAWFLYGEALRRGGNYEQAIEPLQHASMLMPKDADVYRQLGFACKSAGKAGDALAAFNNATKCDPDNSEYYSLRAALYRNAGMIEEALREAKIAYNMTPDDDAVRFEYFFALHDDAMKAMSYNRSSGKHLIIRKKQLDYVNARLKELALTIPQDEDKSKCLAALEKITKIVVEAETSKGNIFTSRPGYVYNYDISNAETRASGLQ